MAKGPTSTVTLNAVAQYAGVSTTTVSRVLNHKGEISDETRRKVFAAIEALGYRPSLVAQGLRTKASHLIGLMLPEILSPLFTEIAMGVEIEASQAGYTIIHTNTFYSPGREKSGMHYLLDRYVDGVVCYSPTLPEAELIPLLSQVGPSVVINLPIPSPEIGELKVDNDQGMRLAIAHLLEQGARRIAYYAPSTSSWNSKERERAFIQASRDAGQPFNPHLLLNFERDASQTDQLARDPSYMAIPEGAIETGEWAARRFLESAAEIDAIIAFNDLCAIGILRGLLAARQRIPGDIAVVGFDNSLAGKKYMPSLTSLGVTRIDIGRQAARMVIDNLENGAPLTKNNLEFDIKPRESTLGKKNQ